MPNYVASPFKAPPQLLVSGQAAYVWGSFNDHTGPTLGNVISNSGVTTTATLKFQLLSGNVPVAGSLITVVGCANSANFNVTNVAIISVSAAASPDAGVYTVTYAISSTNQATLADGGQVVVPQPEVSETISATGASVPVSAGAVGPGNNGRSLSVTVKLPNSGSLSGLTVVIQGANFDIDSEYATIGTITASGAANNTYEWQSGQAVGAAAPGVVGSGSVDLINFRFYRLNVTVLTSGTGPIIGKIVA